MAGLTSICGQASRDFEIFARALLERERLEDVIARFENLRLAQFPELPPGGLECVDVSKLHPTTRIPIRNRRNRLVYDAVRIVRRVPPGAAAVPHQDRDAARECLLICNALTFMFAQEDHGAATRQCGAEIFLFVEAVANLGE